MFSINLFTCPSYDLWKGVKMFVDLANVFDSIDKAWSPVDIAQVNDQVVRAALFHGEYHWHKHAEEDELFLVYQGLIRIRIRNHSTVELTEGQLFVVPRGVEHKPESDLPSIVLMFEPMVLKSKGD
jgi:mannose-6-phosphate isomerase-like protein (cupin superfamily)